MSKLPKLDCVLIDDDMLVHMTWKMVAREKGLQVTAVSSREEFMGVCGSLDRSTPVYVDSNLGDGVKGEELAKELHDAGFSNIYLATGYAPETFNPMPWIKGVVGKEPPWA